METLLKILKENPELSVEAYYEKIPPQYIFRLKVPYGDLTLEKVLSVLEKEQEQGRIDIASRELSRVAQMIKDYKENNLERT